MRYDPDRGPPLQQWLTLREDEQIELVRIWHRKHRVRLPNERIHAMFHVVVENQAALGDEIPVAEALDRLISEGLNRHEAIHAVASVLAGHMWALQAGEIPGDTDPNLPYFEEVKGLTAEKWRQEYATDPDSGVDL